MPPRNILMKPASGDCNLRCRYCFYHDEAAKRQCRSYGRMSRKTLETIIAKTMADSDGFVTFGFQGGEPTLAGLDFFKDVVALEKKYSRPGLQVSNALQTNGTLLDRYWAAFLKENQFLVGLSLDGDQSLHDLYRVDAAGNGTFHRVMDAARLLRDYQVDFNILTVVTAQTARHAARISRFFDKQGFCYQQYIPCLDPLGEEKGSCQYSLTPELYGKFLISIFDGWYQNMSQGKFSYNRMFNNLLGICMGWQPEACGMLGQCGVQYAVEADGSVYPCDFYMLDDYRIGSFLTDSFEEMDAAREKLGFIQKSALHKEECRACSYFALCRGGCRRDRPLEPDGTLGTSSYCPAYRMFFDHAAPKLLELAKAISRRAR